MDRHYSSKTALRILCALFLLISAAVAAAGPVDSVQAQAPAQQQSAGGVTDTWAVQVSPGTDPDQLALQMGAQNLGQIGSLTNYYLFRIPGTDSEVTAMADVFAANSQVVWFEQQVARQQTKRVIEDPVYLDQWHLVNANVEPAWIAGFTGTGVNIAIVDDGLQHSHPDLAAQYKAALSHDYNGDAPLFAEDGDPEDALAHQDYHGTASAGIAAADYNGNSLATSCGVGVAYDAGLSGLRLIAAPATDAQEADALNFGMNPASPGADFNSIYSNSWGPIDGPDPDNGGNWQLAGPGPLTLSALQAGVTSGRNGKGSIYVWAAGNGLPDKDNVNYDGYANSRYTIAVGAVDDQDVQAPYSESGAAMLVTAPGGISGPNGIVTTDLLGHFGYSFNTDCTEGNFDGTSASAPLVSGVVALMLDANPNLGWRDVQYILARTAVKNDPTDADWIDNRADLNGGVSFHVNHKYGFGLVDAAAAVDMANPATYINLPRAASLSSGVVVPDIDNQNIPDSVFVDGAYDGVFSTYNVTREMTVEHVEVVFKSSENLNQLPPGTGGYRGDLRIVLTSPSGTVSVLSEPHGDSAPDYENWKFMTVRNWGESSLGEWTLRVTDEKGGGVSVFDSWQLILHGTGLTADIDVTIGGDLKGSYTLFPGEGNVVSYSDVNGGPVVIKSNNGQKIIASLLQFRRPGTTGEWTDLTQTMALTDAQISDKYVFPRYDYSDPKRYNSLQIANYDSVETNITVEIGGQIMGTYPIGVGGSQNVTFPSVVGGPVVVSSDNGANIIVSLYELKRPNSGYWTGQTQMMGLPWLQLSDTYIIPRYNYTLLDVVPYVVFANAGDQTTQVTVTIGGTLKGTYTLLSGQSTVQSYSGANGGPVVIKSNNGQKIIASLLQFRRPGTTGEWTGLTQTMALTDAQISDKYVFPRYDYSDLKRYNSLQIANYDSVETNIIVEIGGQIMGTYPIGVGGSQNVTFPSVVGGPVVVSSDNGANIIVSLYELKRPNSGYWTGQTQMMGLPWLQLSDTYIIPRYNYTLQDVVPYVVFAVP